MAEVAAPIDGWNYSVTQIQCAAQVGGLLWKAANVRPALNLADRHYVGAVMVFVGGNDDRLAPGYGGLRGGSSVPIVGIELARGIGKSGALAHGLGARI